MDSPRALERPVYRDPLEGAHRRRQDLVATAHASLAALTPRFEEIYRRRFARAAASAVAIAIACVLGVSSFGAHEVELTQVLLSAVIATPLTWLVARAWARRAFRRRMAECVVLGADPFRDIARLESVTPEAHARRLLRDLELASLGLPLIALSMLAPLLLHFVVYSTVLARFDIDADAFGTWIRLSVLIVGHAHLTLAYHAWRFARQLHATPVHEVGHVELPTSRALGYTIVVSAIPGLILLGIPPILVAVTGMMFVPSMFAWARRTLRTERLVSADV